MGIAKPGGFVAGTPLAVASRQKGVSKLAGAPWASSSDISCTQHDTFEGPAFCGERTIASARRSAAEL
jgi:hypothetical protein